MKNLTTPKRSEIAKSDKWNIELLFKNDEEWEAALAMIPEGGKEILKYKEAFSKPETIDAATLLACLKASTNVDRIAEKVGNYAFLQKSSNEGDPDNIKRQGKYMMTVTELSAATSWLMPAIMEIPEEKIRSWIDPSSPTGKDFADFKVSLEKTLHLKPHTLSDKEEKILSLLSEPHGTPSQTFSVLTNVDFDFGTITTKEGDVKLTQSSYSKFMQNPDRALREKAYKQFYGVYNAHKNTIASLYTGQVQQNVALAKIRGYTSAREKSLYVDKVPTAVYDNLVDTIHKNLKPLHKFYGMLKKHLGLKELCHYDVYMPLVSEVKKVTPYNEAVDIITEALKPLGEDYVKTIRNGLLNGWVDKYENEGKRSGAFSAGGYDSDPYILMNYKEDVIRDVFTLVHEGGHSMHSWYSVRNNPYPCYHYTIFEAEVASTFNEELLFRHMIKTTTDPKMRAYLLSVRASDILATLYRQTMFAEYEKITHALVESGTPLTVENLRSEYKKLLELYFGPEMVFEDVSDLEGMRIPHFYRAFYVYKYATGISASMALAERVCSGGDKEREDYFKFLKSGGSRYPIESLKLAGVDMASPAPVQAACDNFAKIVDELEKALEELKK
ncbi:MULTISPECIES: oligoendopeptidase F [unclassified Treponema]|uniref:oligoendopeptidase F n=1 Tax=unclassified Treponema TaxID=2638727 RepID=UPI0020A4DB59|nr:MULTISPECIES: oligoendopeptidase F [unclassified Treponema]UTC67181.1 oligoendopeptidase F [Treponema sp. OMZ 789]UTC69911.1 oligoendopeptidase F [Treponema sp. OMZ 790]UTC72626.1 oligoendopeptidase F [Treponema sp. OMZ 791]